MLVPCRTIRRYERLQRRGHHDTRGNESSKGKCFEKFGHRKRQVCISSYFLFGGGGAGRGRRQNWFCSPHHVLTPYAYIYKARELPRHSCFFQGHRLVALPQKGLTAGSANANRLGRRARRSTVRRRGVDGGIGAKRCDQIPSQFHNAGAVRDMRTLIDLQQCVGQ